VSFAPYPPAMSPRPRRSLFLPVLSVLLVLTALVAVGGGATAVSAAGGGTVGTARFVSELRPQVRDKALSALLDRRTKAVRAGDKAAFMADVDGHDDAFRRRQAQEFDNLTKLPLAEFSLELTPTVGYDHLVPPAVDSRYQGVVRAAAVTVRYRIDGVDSTPVAAPWIPVFGASGGRWRLAAVVSEGRLPSGANGQPWDGGPIAVARSARVVLVLSADDAGRAPDVLKMAEHSLDEVSAVRPAGWAGRILIIAVQDAKLFTTYFGTSADRIDKFAAIAVPFQAGIPSWGGSATFAATRIVFNPHEFGAAAEELARTLTHEFTHAAMEPVNDDSTPLWLVEGFAEYVSYRTRPVPAGEPRRWLDSYPAGGTPPEADFYGDSRNYVLSWLTCRMIAERYGEAKLIALYDAFHDRAGYDRTVRRALGISVADLDAEYASYIDRTRGGT
jgi:hypothetical protein